MEVVVGSMKQGSERRMLKNVVGRRGSPSPLRTFEAVRSHVDHMDNAILRKEYSVLPIHVSLLI